MNEILDDARVKKLGGLAAEYYKDPGNESFGKIIAALLDMYVFGGYVPTAMVKHKTEDGELEECAAIIPVGGGRYYSVLQTEPSGRFSSIEGLLFRDLCNIVYNEKKCLGVVINPDKEMIVIRKEIFNAMSSISAGHGNMAIDSGDYPQLIELTQKRPFSEGQMNSLISILTAMKSDPGYIVHLVFPQNDEGDSEIKEMYITASENGEYHNELCLDMTPFGWIVPQVLYKDMDEADEIDFLDKLCAKALDVENIEGLMSFRSM